MHQYRVSRLVRMINSETLTAELDLGFNIKTEVTFRMARITEPELDLDSDIDPAVELRRRILTWLKSAPKPWTVQMYKEGGVYTGDVIDKNGNLLSDNVTKPNLSDETQVVSYGPLSAASMDPGTLS